MLKVNTASPYFNLLWTGSHILPQHFQPYQKVNHFPSSSELTRKDKFYRNVRHMQRDKVCDGSIVSTGVQPGLLQGQQHFSIIPTSFVLPEEVSQFLSAFKKWGGVWIVKPVASSRGRGIFLVNHPKQVPAGEAVVVSRYVENPLCIDGLKFDSRLYVAVTSVDPLCIYLYQEGLVRFATVQYTGSNRDLHNQYMHLTNYSVNKNNPEYIRCTDPGLEDFGNKWSFSALLRHLQKEGVDTTWNLGMNLGRPYFAIWGISMQNALMMRIEDVIIKSILAAEPQISAACSIAQPYSRNCFELYGFDILIDKNLQPWVLEVNLSPSLACDTPLDLKVKFNLMADLLSLIGANGSVVVTNAVSCHTLISGMGTIDPNLGSGSSVVIPHVEQIKTPLCKKLACLEKAAGNLSVYKVRQLFACYMSHVQKRLMADQDSRYDQKMKANEDDQGIDVVVQLLRKASRNMKISLDIFVPHHSLPLRYRKKILGRQLLQFIAIFKKETAQYKSADEQSCCPLSPSDFKAFLLEAREPDLEQLLETYAKKSTVSIFCDVPTLSKQLSRVTSAVLVSHDATGNGQLLQPNGSFGSCNCSKSVCQCDVVSHKTQQHLERPMFGLHSQPATPASVASVALMQEYSNGSRQVSHDGLKWLPSHDGRRSYSAVTGQHGDQQQKPIQPDVKTATAHLSKPPASVPVSKKATTPVSRPLPHPLGSNKPAPRCLSAAHSTSRTSAGVLSDSRNSRVLSNGSCIGWHSDPEAPIKRMHSDPEAPIKRMHSDPEASIKRMHSDPEASIKRMHRLSGHSSLQKKVDSGGSVSLETETSGPSHIHERSNDQVGCQPVQLKEGSRRPSPQGLLVQGVTDSSCSTTKGKYEWVECLSPERKEDAHKAENQLKLRAHSEAIAKHLLKDLILTRDNRDPVHLSWSRDFKETLQRS
eukprot:Em0019g207a